METIILISVYLLSVLITRYVFIKCNFTEPPYLIICLIPALNIFGIFTVLMTIISAHSYPKKITDWFFGIKKD